MTRESLSGGVIRACDTVAELSVFHAKSMCTAMATYLDDNEEVVALLSDPEVDSYSKTGLELKKAIETFVSDVRNKTLDSLKALKEDVEKSYDDSRKARIAGTSATVTGSVLAIVGFGLSFVTFGASLGLGVAGSVLAVAGGVTIGGAEIGYFSVSRSKLKQAERDCKEDREQMHMIENIGRKLSDHLDSLVKKHSAFSKEQIFQLLRYTSSASKPAAQTFYGGYKLLDGGADLGRNALAVTKSVRAGVQAGARTLWAGVGVVGRVFSIGGVVLDVIFVPVDLTVMFKSAYDVHKYKKTNKSNSVAARRIKDLVTQLEEHNEKLVKFQEELQDDTSIPEVCMIVES